MSKMIVLLWLVPVLLGLVALVRLGRGESVLRPHEQQLLFGNNNKDVQLSIWLGVKLAALSIVLFLAGVFHGLVVANFGLFWMMLLPLVTAICMILILALWLRSASEGSRAEADAHSEAQQSSATVHRFDGFEL